MKIMCHLLKLFLLPFSATLVLSTTALKSQETSAAHDRKPVIILEERTRMGNMGKSIWNLNSLNPSFVLYDDGLTVYRKSHDSSEYLTARLDESELNALLKKFEVNEFLDLEDSYSTNNKFHQPINFIKYWQESKMKKVRVIGSLRDDAKDRSRTPKAFLTIFDQLTSFKEKNAQIWTPYQLEIALYSQNSPQGKPVQWPSNWPDLNHESSKKRSDPDLSHSYNIYLDGKHKKELEQMISNLKDNQPVMINDKPWYLAPKKYIFQNERMWK